MKILHTADWHLGYRQYGMKVREEDFLKPLNEIASIAIREHVDAVLIAGDMFDSFRPPASAVSAAQLFSEKMRDAGITVYTIDGNHDLSDGRWSSICGFRPLQVCQATPVPFATENGTRICGIDFCRTQQLTERLQALIDNKVDLEFGILALHMEISELTAYSTALSLNDLEPYLDALNVGYVALGHIHNKVATSNAAGRIYKYPGSTEMNDISELGSKSVTIIERTGNEYKTTDLTLNTRKFEVVDIDSAESIDTKLTPMMTDPETFWLVKVNLSAPGKLVARVEEVLKDRLYRILPYGNRTIEENMDKATVVVGLKDAIGKFFEPGSDEAALISQIIDSPTQVKTIAQEYVDNKTKGEDK